MALQHDPQRLPGVEAIIDGAPEGSIAAGVRAFHQGWVTGQPVTSRRSYERSLAFFLRFLELEGPSPHAPLDELHAERAVAHLWWRVRCGLTDAGELRRSVIHLGRLSSWLAESGQPVAPFDRAALKAAVEIVLAAVPPPFHVARTSAELRDTAGEDAGLAG